MRQFFVSVVMLIVSVVAPIWDQRILQISMVDLHFITSIDQLLFKLKLYFPFFYKTTYLNEEVTCTEPFLQLAFPVRTYRSRLFPEEWPLKRISMKQFSVKDDPAKLVLHVALLDHQRQVGDLLTMF
jgi:hypothetical protein